MRDRLPGLRRADPSTPLDERYAVVSETRQAYQPCEVLARGGGLVLGGITLPSYEEAGSGRVQPRSGVVRVRRGRDADRAARRGGGGRRGGRGAGRRGAPDRGGPGPRRAPPRGAPRAPPPRP